jgi:chitin-binding protein
MTTGGRGHPRPPVASKASDTSPLSTLTAVLLTLIPWSGTAVAHGSVVDPASRNYGCWDRWGDDFQNPAMADEDPHPRRAHRTRRGWGAYRRPG